MNLEEALQAIYKAVGASPDDHFVFTSSGAEAVNHVIFSTYLDITRKTGKNHFVTTAQEEAAQILSMSRQQELGCAFQMATSPSYMHIAEAISPRTAIVSIAAANGLTGVIANDLPQIEALCKERDIVLHIDASHVLCKSHFTWVGDVLTFHGEDIGAKPACGGLFLRSTIEMSPLILGGEEQGGMRGGSFSTEHLIELGHAFETSSPDHYMTEIALLRNLFETTLVNALPDVSVLFENEMRVPHITCIEFEGIHTETLRLILERKGVASQAGGGRFQRLALLLRACKIESHSALSFNFSRHTTRAQIEETVSIIVDVVKQLRKFSHHLVSV